MELHAGRGPTASTRWVDLGLFYLFQLSPACGSRPGKVVHFWITENILLRLQRKGWLQRHCHQNRGNCTAPSAPTQPSCICICLHCTAERHKVVEKDALRRFAQMERCTTLTLPLGFIQSNTPQLSPAM